MAGEDRSKTDPVAPEPAPGPSLGSGLESRLEAEPYSFDFFQAVRRLERLFRDAPPPGFSQRPAQDPLRFCQEASLAFAPSTVWRYERSQDDQPPTRLFVNFMGLLGPNGPMPLHLTEYVRERELHFGDHGMARFFDLFNHRMISLFYRAWSCGHQAVNYQRGKGDRFAVYFASLFGAGMPSFRDRDSVPDVAKLHFSGRLVCQTRHAEGLRALLADYFGVPADVEEFCGQWIDVPADCACRLGESRLTGEVGRTVIVGSRLWDCQQKFRLRLGPMGLADYERLLPGGRSLRRLVDWVRNYAGDAYAWDVRLVLKAAEVPKTTLGRQGKLGWTTWMRSRPFTHDADDLVLRPQSQPAA